MIPVSGEGLRVNTKTIVWKIENADEDLYEHFRRGGSIEEIVRKGIKIDKKEIAGNVLLIEGANFIWRAIRGDSGLTPFNEANAHIGVGDGSEPESRSQVGLTGANKYYKRVDSGYPVVADNKIIFRATFGPGEANFEWNEWTVANGSSDNAVNLNRRVEKLGTKGPGSVWVLQVELSIS